MFLAVKHPVECKFIKKNRPVKMKVLQVPGRGGEEELGIHIIDSGIQGMVEGLVKGYGYQEGDMREAIIINHRITNGKLKPLSWGKGKDIGCKEFRVVYLPVIGAIGCAGGKRE